MPAPAPAPLPPRASPADGVEASGAPASRLARAPHAPLAPPSPPVPAPLSCTPSPPLQLEALPQAWDERSTASQLDYYIPFRLLHHPKPPPSPAGGRAASLGRAGAQGPRPGPAAGTSAQLPLPWPYRCWLGVAPNHYNTLLHYDTARQLVKSGAKPLSVYTILPHCYSTTPEVDAPAGQKWHQA